MAYKKIEQYDDVATEELGKNYREVIKLIGENPEREGLLKTRSAWLKRCSLQHKVIAWMRVLF